MLPFKFGLGTQLRVLPELGAGNTPEPGMGKVCNWVHMFQRVHAVKHSNPFFSSSPALRKPSWTGSRETSNRWKLLSRLSRGTFTTWKLPTRLSFKKKEF